MFVNRIVAALLLASLTGTACRKKAPAGIPGSTQPSRPAEEHPAPAKPGPRPKARPAAAAPTAPPQPAQAAPPSAEPSPPPPQLGQIVSPEERHAQTGAIEAALHRTRLNISVLKRRTLTAQERATLRQAEGLAIQAEELRKTDLESARSLADRAELLTKDLLRMH